MPTYSDININLEAHPGTGDVLKRLDVDAVKQSMKNIIFGDAFDVPFNPHYGAGLRRLMFENITESTIAVARRKVMLALSEFEPRVVIEDLYIGDDGQNGLNIGVKFHVIGNPSSHTLNFVMGRIK